MKPIGRMPRSIKSVFALPQIVVAEIRLMGASRVPRFSDYRRQITREPGWPPTRTVQIVLKPAQFFH